SWGGSRALDASPRPGAPRPRCYTRPWRRGSDRAGRTMVQQTTAWDAIFRQRGKVFTHPQEDMPALADALLARGATTILDLGCGTGRHVVYFAERSFTVSGLDSAPEGLRLTEQALRDAGRTANLRLGD